METCETHGGTIDQRGCCQTWLVLTDVSMERARQFQRYGTNTDNEDGTGPKTRWAMPLSYAPAADIEDDFRSDYQDYEEETGSVTWVHLVREEIAEAFAESDPTRLREELIQVAALCVSWIEKLDSR